MMSLPWLTRLGGTAVVGGGLAAALWRSRQATEEAFKRAARSPTFDLAVIGGGVVGTSIALNAVSPKPLRSPTQPNHLCELRRRHILSHASRCSPNAAVAVAKCVHAVAILLWQRLASALQALQQHLSKPTRTLSLSSSCTRNRLCRARASRTQQHSHACHKSTAFKPALNALGHAPPISTQRCLASCSWGSAAACECALAVCSRDSTHMRPRHDDECTSSSHGRLLSRCTLILTPTAVHGWDELVSN